MANPPTVAPDTDNEQDSLELLTVVEVAEKLKVKPWAVYKLCDSGALPCVYLGPKSRRVKPADLRAYIEALPSTRPAFAS